jgi:hypothetical protein
MQVRYDNKGGTLGSLLSSSGTTFDFGTSPGFNTLAAGDFIKITIEPGAGTTPGSNREVVYLTAYTAGATTGTCARGQEGTTAISHASGLSWVCAPTTNDFPIGVSPTVAAAPPPARAYRAASGPAHTGGYQKMSLDTISYDPNGYFDVVTNGRYNVPVTGYYHVDAEVYTGGTFTFVAIYKNGTQAAIGGANSTGTGAMVSDVIYCNAGDYLELWFEGAADPSASTGNTDYLTVTPLTQQSIASQITPVAARAYRNTALSFSGSTWTKVPIDTLSFDSGSNMDVGTNHRFNCPVAGYYEVVGEVSLSGGSGAGYAAIYQNGTRVAWSGGPNGSVEGQPCATDILKCAAGDYIELYLYTAGTTGLDSIESASNYLSVSLIQGVPGANLAAARAHRNASLSLTASAWNKIPIDTVDYDPNGYFDVATNHRYNVPAAGPYLVTVSASLGGSTQAAAIYKNGVAVSWNYQANSPVTHADIVQCNAGDYLELYIYSTTTSLSLGSPTSTTNYISITPLVSAVTSSTSSTTQGQGVPNVARAYRNSGFSFSAGTFTKVPLDTKSFDPTGAMVDVVTNGRINIKQAGWYQVDGEVATTSNPTYTAVGIYKNGTRVAIAQVSQTGSGSDLIPSVSDVIQCAAGDYLELWVFSSVTALSVNSSANFLAVAQVAPPGGTGNANALPAGASYQNGVINSADLAISSTSLNTSTGAITTTVASALPVIIKDASGNLCPVTFTGKSNAFTPGSLPASTKYAVYGLEVDVNGLLYIVKGADSSTQLNTGSLIASNSPAITSGRLRFADFALWNNAGTINFSDHTTVASQGVNWIDRRPWARGYNNAQQRTGVSDYTTSSASYGAIDATNLAQRVECTGNQLEIELLGFDGGTSAIAIYQIYSDGSGIGGEVYTAAASAYVGGSLCKTYYTPAAGSHLIVPYWKSGSGTPTLYAGTNRQVQFNVREILAQNANNGTA